MNIKIIFRLLLFVPIVLLTVFAILPSVEHLWLSCDELSLLEIEGYNSILPQSNIIFMIYLVLALIISVALYFFIGLARIVYAIFVFISFILLALLGNRVSTPLDNMLMLLVSLSTGALLGLMYSASMQSLFNKTDSSDENDSEDDEDDLP